jgi:nucleoside-diphosphate-sugar epimerase
VARSFEDPLGDWEANVAGTGRLIEVWRQLVPSGVFVFLSSAAVYGNPRRLPIREGDPAEPISPYGHHKLAAEHILGFYRDQFGIPVRIARIFSTYGPGLDRQVVHEIVAKVRQGANLALQGSGRETRDFIHIEDLTSALLRIALIPLCPPVLNVASGQATKIRDLALTAARLSPRGVSVRFSGRARLGDPRFWRASISRLRSIGFRPKVSLQVGLREMIVQKDVV